MAVTNPTKFSDACVTEENRRFGSFLPRAIALMAICIPIIAGISSGWSRFGGAGLETRLLVPELMGSNLAVGDVFASDDTRTRMVQVSDPVWKARLSQIRPVTLISNHQVIFSLSPSNAGPASDPQGLARFRLKTANPKRGDLTLTLGNVITGFVSSAQFQNDYLPRYEYWSKFPGVFAGCPAVLEVVSADQIEISSPENRPMTRELGELLDRLESEFRLVREAEVLREDGKVVLRGRNLVVFCKVWRIPAPETDGVPK